MYYIEKFILRILFGLFSSYRVEGQENVPREGPLVVVANHLSIADPPALGIFLGRRIVFMAKEEVFHVPLFRYFVRSFGAIPIYRGGGNRDALRRASQLLKEDKAVVIFPEGTRGLQGHMLTGQPGAALLAHHSHVPLLPIGIAGTDVIRGVNWLWKRPHIRIKIGTPFCLPQAGSELTKERLAEYTETMMNRIAALLPLSYRGPYSGKG